MPSLNARHTCRRTVGVLGALCVAAATAGCGTVVASASNPSTHSARKDTAATIKWTSKSGLPQTAAIRQVLDDVNTAFARAEDTYEAMFAPPPATAIPVTALEDNMAIAPRAMLDSTGLHAYLSTADQATIERRGMAALLQIFTSDMAQREYAILVGVVGTESSGQDLLGGGGASVVNYADESINGAQASVQASVQQWSRIGYVNPQSGTQYWQVNRAVVIVNAQLTQSQGGNWLVASRSWNYAPGQGP